VLSEASSESGRLKRFVASANADKVALIEDGVRQG
jgi:hypothetical protein